VFISLVKNSDSSQFLYTFCVFFAVMRESQ